LRTSYIDSEGQFETLTNDRMAVVYLSKLQIRAL